VCPVIYGDFFSGFYQTVSCRSVITATSKRRKTRTVGAPTCDSKTLIVKCHGALSEFRQVSNIAAECRLENRSRLISPEGVIDGKDQVEGQRLYYMANAKTHTLVCMIEVVEEWTQCHTIITLPGPRFRRFAISTVVQA